MGSPGARLPGEASPPAGQAPVLPMKDLPAAMKRKGPLLPAAPFLSYRYSE